ncbi:hypothetical protein DU083_22225 [Salmonella enterica subsp. enterica serovar Javiana]|nr:hypothetical protein [Salmonella enterica subsp. enterica serovar Javiana]
MIYANTPVLGSVEKHEQQIPDPSVVAGRWGLLPAGKFPACANLDTAMVGYMLVTPSTIGNPQSGAAAYGIAWTIATLGAGDDGRRRLPSPAVDQEWITQVLLMGDGSLFERVRTNRLAFTPFVKRW